VRIWWIVFVALTGSLAGVGRAVRGPTRYRGVCLLDYGKEAALFNANEGPALSSDEWDRTQQFILASDSVVGRVVTQLSLRDERPFAQLPPEERRARAQADAIARLRDGLRLEPVEGTHLVRIVADARSPERAASIANTLATSYVDKTLEDRTAATLRMSEWLSQQIRDKNRDLAESEDELQTFLSQPDAPALPPAERQQMLAREVDALNQRLADARVRRVELTSVFAKLKAASEQQAPFDAHSAEIDADEQIQTLRREHLAAQLKQRALAAAQEADSRAISQIETELTMLEQTMREQVGGLVARAHAELSAAQQLEKELQALLQRAEAGGRKLQEQRLAYEKLMRERGAAESFLSSLRERSTSVGLASAGGATGPKIVERAQPASEAVLPPYARYAVLGAIAGVLAGFLTNLLWLVVRRPPVAQGEATRPPVTDREISA
jgi:uncharacterized protein involved in exopolysaccharide biosynthesis